MDHAPARLYSTVLLASIVASLKDHSGGGVCMHSVVGHQAHFDRGRMHVSNMVPQISKSPPPYATPGTL